MKISANILVENEENFVWFSVMSVLPFVDEVLIYDAGSIDRTPGIIGALEKSHKDKVKTKRIGKLKKEEYPYARDEMLKVSNGDWILIVDGDEIWWNDSIREAVSIIRDRGLKLDSLTSRFINCVPDLFHMQDEKASNYVIDGVRGNRTIHAINRHIPNLHVSHEYGKEGYFSNETLVQDLPKERRYELTNISFLHCTHVRRTHVHGEKMKKEIGKALPYDFYYPESLFYTAPEIVPYPFTSINSLQKASYSAISSLKYLKRRVI